MFLKIVQKNLNNNIKPENHKAYTIRNTWSFLKSDYKQNL